MVLPIGLSCAACARVAYLVFSRGHSPRSYPTGARRASMDDGVVLLVGFQMRDFQRPDGLQGAGERVIEGGPRRPVTHGGADLPEGAEYLGPVEVLAGAVVADAHAVQDATDSGVPRSGKGRRWGRGRCPPSALTRCRVARGGGTILGIKNGRQPQLDNAARHAELKIR